MPGQQYDVPMAHYQGLYEKLSPPAAAERCGIGFEQTGEGEGSFLLRLMGTEYRAAFPVFELRGQAGDLVPDSAERILLVRYLCEGKYFPSRGKRLSYNEVPSGPLYYRNFEGRCLKRAARTFGNDTALFRRILESVPGLRFEALDKGDAGYRAGYRFEFLNGLFISLLIWAGDDEFPPSAQMLFDDNFVFAFTAEDLAVVGEVAIRRLKAQNR
ncbi:MAG: DUF3786 domain-containing protein [Treponema sp.]|nr:DUF3786 domain-containing protein [Treponema sp.]